MATIPGGSATKSRGSALGFGAAAVTLAFLGLGFSFLAPFGLLLSAPGLICGIVGWLMARPARSAAFWWSFWGTILSLIAIGVNAGLLDYGTVISWMIGK